MLVWRLEREEFLEQAFHGHGAARYPGRWNLAGLPAAYASESRALAVLETLAHIPRNVFAKSMEKIKYFLVSANIPDGAGVKTLTVGDVVAIHPEWNHTPGPDALKAFGDGWLQSKETLALKVPSVVLPMEHNFIINPRHPDFRGVEVGAPERFVFDPRLL